MPGTKTDGPISHQHEREKGAFFIEKNGRRVAELSYVLANGVADLAHTDQPWKIFEGSVGPYWGIFDSSRRMKFAWAGAVTSPEHWKSAGIAVPARS